MTSLLVRPRRALLTIGVSVIGLSVAHAQGQARWYLSALGSDTLSLERFERAGNTITGLWVTYYSGVGADRHREILCHEYTIALAADGRPRSVHLLLRHPGGDIRRTYDARITDDSMVITSKIVTPPATLPPTRFAAERGFPLLGSAMSMFELFIADARKGRSAPDSAAVVLVPIAGAAAAQSNRVVLTLLSANTLRFGQGTIFTGPRGAIDSLVAPDGRVPVRQVGAFDIHAIALAASKAP